MTPNDPAPALDLRTVEHHYDRTPALRGATLRVDRGEVVAVTGPSGGGKSTLLHVAAGILRPTAGDVHLLGHDLRTLDDAARTRLRRERVGLVLQFGQLIPDLTLLDNVALPLLLGGARRREAQVAAAGRLERVGLGDLGGATTAEVSGGQAQRAAVARALVTDPDVVLADEPTGSMDTVGGEQLLEILLGAARGRGATLVVVTHDNVVAAHADREVRLRDGAVEPQAVIG